VASRKQRKRREKEKRHEYELVVIDETGEERPVEADELRRKREQKEAERGKSKNPGAKNQPARGGTRARGPVKEVKPPSLNRVWKRVAFFGAFMFLVLSFLGGKNEAIGARIALTGIYTLLFVPFIYLMDRVQYRQYLRRTGQEEPPKAGRTGRGAQGAAKQTETTPDNVQAKTGRGFRVGRGVSKSTATPSDSSQLKALGAGLRRGRRR